MKRRGAVQLSRAYDWHRQPRGRTESNRRIAPPSKDSMQIRTSDNLLLFFHSSVSVCVCVCVCVCVRVSHPFFLGSGGSLLERGGVGGGDSQLFQFGKSVEDATADVSDSVLVEVPATGAERTTTSAIDAGHRKSSISHRLTDSAALSGRRRRRPAARRCGCCSAAWPKNVISVPSHAIRSAMPTYSVLRLCRWASDWLPISWIRLKRRSLPSVAKKPSLLGCHGNQTLREKNQGIEEPHGEPVKVIRMGRKANAHTFFFVSTREVIEKIWKSARCDGNQKLGPCVAAVETTPCRPGLQVARLMESFVSLSLSFSNYFPT